MPSRAPVNPVGGLDVDALTRALPAPAKPWGAWYWKAFSDPVGGHEATIQVFHGPHQRYGVIRDTWPEALAAILADLAEHGSGR